MGMASLEFLDRAVLGQHHAIQLQLGFPSWMVHIGQVLSLPAFYWGFLCSIYNFFLLFLVLWWGNLTLLDLSLSFLFFLCKFGLGSRPSREGGRGGGRLGGSWVFRVSLDDDPLLLPGRRSFSLFLRFKAISSSSSELLSSNETLEYESSPSKYESSTGLSYASPSFLRQNWSISASRDRCKEAISSLRAATLREKWWKGNSMGGRSSQAKKLDTETSIRASLGSPVLMALPMS